MPAGGGTSPGAPPAAPARRGPRRLARSLAVPLAAFVASRVLVLATAAMLGWLRGGTAILTTLTFWDGAWYVVLARDGYPDALLRSAEGVERSVHAFFPAYPTLVRGAHAALGTSWELSAVLVAVAFGAVACVLVWYLADAVAGPDVADRSAVLFAFFPGSYVLSTAYSEPVMLTFAVASLWALVRRRWALAGLAAAVATASRPNAAVLVASCAWAAGVAVHQRREWRALLAPALGSVGFLGFLAFLWWRTGEPDAWLLVQREGWDEGIDFGRQAWATVAFFVEHGLANVGIVILVGTMAFALVAAALLAVSRQPGPLKVYGFGILALTLLTRTLVARPRFVLTAVPLLIAVAERVRGAPFAVLVGASAAALPLVVLAYGATTLTGAP